MLTYDRLLFAEMRYREMVAAAEKQAAYRRAMVLAPSLREQLANRLSAWLGQRRSTRQAEAGVALASRA